MKKLHYYIIANIVFLSHLYGQNRLVLNQNIYAVLSNSVYVVVDNPNSNAIITTGTGGNIISENEFNVVKWNIGTSTGNYVVPFTTNSFVKMPLNVNITTAGVGAGSLLFSTYETATDANTAYPSDVTNMNSYCNTSNALYAIDRFWRIDAGTYTTKPTPVISFGYNPAANETGGTNTIVISKFKAERFNSTAGLWETPAKLYGLDNGLNAVAGVSVTPVDFFKSWTLIDTTIMAVPIAALSATICSGTLATLTPTGAVTYTLMPGTFTTTTTFTVNPVSTTIYTISGTLGTGTATCKSNSLTNATPTVNINATPTVAISGNSVICSGTSATLTALTANTYSWNNGTTSSTNVVSPTANTTYTAIGTNTYSAGNCTNSAVYSVSVNATPTVAVSGNSVICSGTSATLTALTANTYSWNNGTTISANVVSPTTNTTYTAIGTNTYSAGNCTNSAVYSVSVNATPTVAITGNSVICSGTSATLTALTANTYSWNNGTTSSANVVSPTANTTYTAIGTNTYSAGNCTNSAVYSVSVNATPTVAVSNATMCSGTSAVLTATTNPASGTTYSWSPNTSTVSTATVNPANNTNYTVTATNSNCSSNAVGTVTVFASSTPTTGFSYTSPVCILSSNPLPNPVTGFSSNGVYSSVAGIALSASTGSINLASSTAGTYTVTYSLAANGCAGANSSTTAIVITNTTAPVTSFSYSTPVCLSGANPTPSLVVNFTNGGIYSGGAGLGINTTSGIIDLATTTAGTYTVNYALSSNSITCVAAGSGIATVTLIATPTITVSPNVTINSGESTNLTSTSSPSTYTWGPTTNLSCSTCSNPIASPLQTTTYCVKTTDGTCSNSVCVTVSVENPCPTNTSLSFPNAFSPNADGNNDAYCVQGIGPCVTAFSILIFDRWGEKVFETTDPNFCWDGLYRGSILDPAVFVYYAKASFSNSPDLTKKGNITLIK